MKRNAEMEVVFLTLRITSERFLVFRLCAGAEDIGSVHADHRVCQLDDAHHSSILSLPLRMAALKLCERVYQNTEVRKHNHQVIMRGPKSNTQEDSTLNFTHIHSRRKRTKRFGTTPRGEQAAAMAETNRADVASLELDAMLTAMAASSMEFASSELVLDVDASAAATITTKANKAQAALMSDLDELMLRVTSETRRPLLLPVDAAVRMAHEQPKKKKKKKKRHSPQTSSADEDSPDTEKVPKRKPKRAWYTIQKVCAAGECQTVRSAFSFLLGLMHGAHTDNIVCFGAG